MKYELITDIDAFEDLLDRIGYDPCALDFEGWDFKVRLAQFKNDDVWAVVDFGDMDKHNWFPEVAHWFEDGTWIAFNSGHEKRCLAAADSWPTVWDVGHLYRAMEGGGHLSLKRLAGLVLDDVDMDKTEQGSNWNTGDLTQSQLDYAADDALHTWDIWRKLWDKSTAGHRKCFNILDGMTDAVIEMEESGLKLDEAYHRTLIEQWQQLSDERDAALREMISTEEVENLNSNKQLSAFFAKILPQDFLDIWPRTEKTGDLSMANKDLINMAGAAGDNYLSTTLRLLAERSTLQKYLSSFGETMITKNRLGKGRIKARYNIGAAITCRFSSSGPNLQQVPRDRDFFGERLSVRRGFIAEKGNKLVSYDYSGIEMVMIALLSGDEQLLQDVLYGDPHGVMAEYVLGRPIDRKVTADNDVRQSMKAVNFGIIYGTTALGLAGRQGWTFEYADNLMQYWAKRYPKAWNLRFKMKREAERTGYIQMIDGGTIFLGKKKPSLTRCANYPVQRAALTVMAKAIILYKQRLDDYRDKLPAPLVARVKLCSTIHDALIAEAPAELAEEVDALMKQAMLDAYRDVFPQLADAPDDKLLEGGSGPSWGELDK